MFGLKVNFLVFSNVLETINSLRHDIGDKYHGLIEVRSGQEMLTTLNRVADVALIIVDVSKEERAKFIQTIKSCDEFIDMPIIFLIDLVHDKQWPPSELNSVMFDHLCKPYSASDLQSKVSMFVDVYVKRLRLDNQAHQRAAVQQRLHLSEQLFEQSPEGLMLTDSNTVIKAINPKFIDMIGYSVEELIGKKLQEINAGILSCVNDQSISSLTQKGDGWEGELYKQDHGDAYSIWLKVFPIKNKLGDVNTYVYSFSKNSLDSLTHQKLHQLAHYDSLTGLPNRSLFQEHLKNELANAQRNKTFVAVLFMDLDHFKSINDTLGHDVGDELLKAVAARLLKCIRKNDLISRQGGDEFTGVLVGINHPENAGMIAEKIIKSLSQPVQTGPHQLFITSSIGISIYPNDGETFDSLIKHADSAMYQAKDSGRNTYHFFTDELHQASKRRFELGSLMHKGLENNEFEVYYQPQVDAGDGFIIGMEALLRWHSAELGSISPAEFIPIAEESGLIVPIGEWVMREACKQCKKWRDDGYPALLVAVNLSSRQFREPNFINMLLEVICETGISPRQLELELTESIIMKEDVATIRRLREINECGVQLSIDDFGTGYSSMSYLKRFPLDKLKIDKSFIDNVTTDSEDASIVSAIINLAHSLKLIVIAEGVEEKDQRNWLQKNDCDEIQGYFYSRPLTVNQFTAYMQNNPSKVRQHFIEDSKYQEF